MANNNGRLRKWINTQESIKTWLNHLRTESYRQTVLHNFAKFADFLKMKPDEILALREKERKSTDKKTKFQMEDRVADFKTALEKEGMTEGSIKTVIIAVRSFFKYNRSKLELLIQLRGDSTSRSKKALTIQDVKKMAMLADIDDKALLVFLLQTGCSGGTIPTLTCGDIRRFEEPPFVIEIKPRGKMKKRKPYSTLLGTDGVTFLEASLSRRKALGEEIGHSSPLFIDKYNKPLSGNRVNQIITDLALESNVSEKALDQRGKSYCTVTAHSLRKLFQRSCEAAKIDHNWIRQWMGHVHSAEERPYTELDVTKWREAYKEVEPKISITYEPVKRGMTAPVMNDQMIALTEAYMRLLAQLHPQKYEQIAKQLLQVKANIQYDPKKEIVPAIIVMQTATKNVLDELANRKKIRKRKKK